ncbi:hypothetical protein ACWEKT_14705 [Nocardia takedensis]|uniref:hypothetical protein n=1 Tax=Nocardia takedensis TaxID=259390 RepID=UPI000313DF06|nr:hypothetical protein [Nocardia takedensis]
MKRLRSRGDNGEASRARTLDPTVDPPIVTALLEPILTLRASLGTGAGAPDPAIVDALSAASNQAAESEEPHRRGVHALESTWTSGAADLAVPSLRTTQTELGEISDRGPAYVDVLADAQTTSSRGAQKVDQIIADFRRDARRILGVATASPDTDAVIERGAQALRDAIDTVQTTRTEMDDHTRRLDGMAPLTVSAPAGVTANAGTSAYPNVGGGTGGTTQYLNGTTAVTTANGQPMDPVLAAQLQLQQQLISAGVQVGTAAISAGVDIGTHLIDKIVEVGTHAMDTVAASADKAIAQAIPELLHPGSTTDPAGAGTGTPKSGAGQFDFGGTGAGGTGGGQGAAPNTGNGRGGSPQSNAQNDPPTTIDPRPAPMPQNPFSGNSVAPNGSGGTAAAPVTPRAAVPEPAQQHGPTGGVAMPPQSGAGDQDHKPRDGQLGVTVPAALDLEPVTVPAAVIGDFGDDFA